jgi:hypothetical protein
LELIIYNFVLIFIILTIIILCVLIYRIYKRKQKTGLGPRVSSIFYIDGFNSKSIGNILCIIGIIIAVFSLFNPWYKISTDIGITGYETNGMADMMTIDGINGIQIQVPGLTGPIPMGSITIPFSFLIAIGIIFLFIASIGIAHSKKLGKKYIYRGIRLIIPIILIFILIMALSMIPFESLVDTGDASVDISEVVGAISGSPTGGQKIVTIPDIDGQIELNWGFGLGGMLLILSGLILIIAGILEITSNSEFFSGNGNKKGKKEKKLDEESKKPEIKEKTKPDDKEKKNKKTTIKGICPVCGEKFESDKITEENGKTYTRCNHCGKKLKQKEK